MPPIDHGVAVPPIDHGALVSPIDHGAVVPPIRHGAVVSPIERGVSPIDRSAAPSSLDRIGASADRAVHNAKEESSMVLFTVWNMVALAVILAVLAGSIVLQVFLSKKDAWWPGLILPGLTLLFAAIVSVGMLAYNAVGSSTIRTTNEATGEVIEERTTRERAPMSAVGAGVATTFLLYNVPTAVYLAIYAAYRGKRRRQRSLKRMRAQDLE